MSYSQIDNNDIGIKDSLISISYLVWIILKQQWKLVLVLIFMSLLVAPAAHLFFTMSESYKLAAGLIASFAILPSLLLLLVMLPIINSQISSTSIKKRLAATGFDMRIYALTIILTFALLATLLFYGMILISVLTFGNKVIYYYGYYDLWTPDIAWIALLTLTPISMIGLSSTGLLIGRWKAPEIAKGVAVFLFIIALLSISRTHLSLWDNASENYSTPEEIARIKRYDNILLFANPFGAMIFTAEYGMIGDLIKSAQRFEIEIGDGSLANPYALDSFTEVINGQVTYAYAILWTSILTGLTVWKSN